MKIIIESWLTKILRENTNIVSFSKKEKQKIKDKNRGKSNQKKKKKIVLKAYNNNSFESTINSHISSEV